MTLTLDKVWKGYPSASGHGGRPRRGFPVRRRAHGTHWALRDVSVDVRAGESIGLIGANGSGKSSLLRLAAGLGRPSRGMVSVAPGTVAVLNLGDTFDPELTGRENALTGALVSGLSRARSREVVGDVIEFAELEEFADSPVRIYSEGMKLRLAFGIVAQLNPSTLLVDEVLAVGDVRFQQKCLDCIRGLRSRETTLLIASHDLRQLEAECDRILWLADGAVKMSGKPAEVTEAYRGAMMSRTVSLTPAASGEPDEALALRRNRFGSQELTISDVAMTPAGESSHAAAVRSGGSLWVRIVLSGGARGTGPSPASTGAHLVVALVRRADGVKCCDFITDIDVSGLDAGPLLTDLQIESLELTPGDYDLEVGVYEAGWEYAFDLHTHAYEVRVTGGPEGGGVYAPKHRWSTEEPGQ